MTKKKKHPDPIFNKMLDDLDALVKANQEETVNRLQAQIQDAIKNIQEEFEARLTQASRLTVGKAT